MVVMRRDDYHVHEDIFEFVALCDDADCVVNAIKHSKASGARSPPSFFDAFDAETLDTLLARCDKA